MVPFTPTHFLLPVNFEPLLSCNNSGFLLNPVQITLRVSINHRFISASFCVTHNTAYNRFFDAGFAVFFDANERPAEIANTGACSRTVSCCIFIEIRVKSRTDSIWNYSYQFFLKMGSATCLKLIGLWTGPVILQKPVLKLVFKRAARPSPTGDDAVLRFLESDFRFWKTSDIRIEHTVDNHVIIVIMKKTNIVGITRNSILLLIINLL